MTDNVTDLFNRRPQADDPPPVGMRLTIDLDPELARQACDLARDEDSTVAGLVRELLRAAAANRKVTA